MSQLIKPKEITVTDADKSEHTFIISRFPAIAGREIIASYTSSLIPKTGEYKVSQEAMLKLMKHVAVVTEDGTEIVLRTASLVDNHVPDAEALIRLEIEMMRENTSFFQRGGSQTLAGYLLEQANKFAPKIMPMLTRLLQQSSAQDTPPSQNSKHQ